MGFALSVMMVIPIRPKRVRPGDGLGPASGIEVGDCYDRDVLPPVKDEVVSVIPVAGVADDDGVKVSYGKRASTWAARS